MREYDKYQGIRHTFTSNSRERRRKWITLSIFRTNQIFVIRKNKLVQIN